MKSTWDCMSDIMKDLFIKAEDILLIPDAIVNAPGMDALFVQHSKQGNCPPHLITSVKTTGTIICDDCTTFKSLKLCSHLLAAAEHLGVLQNFLSWREKEKSSINLSDLIMGNVRSCTKPKVAKPRKGGRTPLVKDPPTTIENREPVLEADISETLRAL